MTKPRFFGSLEIDYEFEFGRLKNWQVGRLRALENPSDVNAALSVRVRDTRAIGCFHQRGHIHETDKWRAICFWRF
jgi:hypothetical protein